MENIERITKELISGQYNLDPNGAANSKAILAGEYSRLTERLNGVVKIKPAMWNELRKGLKSDTSTDRAWEATEWGQEEQVVKNLLKSVEKTISALNSLIRAQETDYHQS